MWGVTKMIEPNPNNGFLTNDFIHMDGTRTVWKSPYLPTTDEPSLIYQVVHYGHTANEILISNLEKATETFGLPIENLKYRINEWISSLKTTDISVMIIIETEETVNTFILFEKHWYHFEFYTRFRIRPMFIPSVKTEYLPSKLAIAMIDQMLEMNEERDKINEVLKNEI